LSLDFPTILVSAGRPPALAVFARAPVAGEAKTRLIPLLGPRGAADFHAALLSDTLRKVSALGRPVAPHFFLAGRDFPVTSSLSEYTLWRQSGAGLGERLGSAFRRLLDLHPSAVVVGTDSPMLAPRLLRAAFAELRICEAVLGPCPDGGFYLLGLRRLPRGLFRGVRWGSAFARRDVLARMASAGLSCAVLEPCADVDLPGDVERLRGQMLSSPAARRLAPCTWSFLKDFFAIPSRPASAAVEKFRARGIRPRKVPRARSSRRR
jgi:uncharacterized protein